MLVLSFGKTGGGIVTPDTQFTLLHMRKIRLGVVIFRRERRGHLREQILCLEAAGSKPFSRKRQRLQLVNYFAVPLEMTNKRKTNEQHNERPIQQYL